MQGLNYLFVKGKIQGGWGRGLEGGKGGLEISPNIVPLYKLTEI